MLTVTMIDRQASLQWQNAHPLNTQLYDMIVCPKACLLFYYTLKRV